MPKRSLKTKTHIPENLRPYEFHGVDVSGWNGKSRDVVTDCPFCGREEKFNIVISSGISRCVVCNTGNSKGGMNASSFIQNLWKLFKDTTNRYETVRFAAERRLSVNSLEAWGVVKSSLTDNWIVPAFNAEGTLTQLYSYRKTEKGMTLFPTPTLGAQLFGVCCYNPKAKTTYLTEGPWDGMALAEALSEVRYNSSKKLVSAVSPETSLAADSGVLAVPGASTFNPGWSSLMADNVVVMYDNDHERIHEKSGKTIPPAGINGVKKVAHILSNSKQPPKKIRYLKWGEKGWDSTLPHGCDIRDILTGNVSGAQI